MSDVAAKNAVSRRSFIQRSGGLAVALGAPAIVPATVLGARSPANQIGIGLIGMGRQMTKPNMPQFLALPDVRVVAVCDVDSWRLEWARIAVDAHYAAQAGKGSYRGCSAHRDFRELLARPEVDAVMIATPDHWHVPIAIEAVRAGKHVSVEKPLTICVADGRALCDAVARRGVVSRTDSEFRSLKPFARAVELVRNGRIGRLHTIRTGVPVDTPGIPPQPDMPVPPELDYEKWLGPAPEAPYTEKRVHARQDLASRPNWMRISDYANGMIANWGTHLNDIAQWANGTETSGPVDVEAEGEFTRGLWNTMIKFEARYTYANGVRLICRSDMPHIRFEGTDGWIRVDYPDKMTAEPAGVLQSVIGAAELHLADQLEDKADFIAAIRGGRATLEPVEVGHRTVTISQIGLIAMEVGGKLRWDPARERFIDDNAANARLTRSYRDWRRAYGG
jgi:myo-inositol 2-dehydrogenase / D-chiro-inositol 1-dehydrogenase